MKKILTISVLLVSFVAFGQLGGGGGGVTVDVDGEEDPNLLDTDTYVVTVSSGNHTSTSYNINGGTIVSQSTSQVTVQWTNLGQRSLAAIATVDGNMWLGSLSVTVHNVPIDPGEIAASSAMAICGTIGDPSILTNTESASGGVDTLSYLWESSTDNSNWTEFTGNTLETYDPPTISASTYFRRTVNDGTQSEVSNVIYFELLPKPSMPVLSVSEDSVLVGTEVTMNSSNSTDKWYLSESGTTSVNEGSSYTLVLNETTTFYVESIGANTCASDRESITIYVLTPSIISSESGLALGQSNILFLLDKPPGYSVQWRKDSVSVSGATADTLVVNETGIYDVILSGPSTYQVDANEVVESVLAQNMNFVRTRVFKHAVSSVPSTPDNSLIGESTKYFDGLGRLTQQTTTQGSPMGRDIVSFLEYDDLGRQPKEYLPYVSEASSGNYRTSYMSEQENFNHYDEDTVTFSEKRFENSPLNRVLEQAAPGDVWQLSEGKTVKMNYDVNAADEVIIWQISNDLPTSSGFYSVGELYKNTTTDEDGNQSIEFTNKQGQTVLKKAMVDTTASDTTWADTYYVYDIYNNLRTVLPPVLSANSPSSGSWDPPTDSLKMLAFTYEYDGRNRMIAKQVPGADTVYMVYDQWDRLVLTQDGVQRTSNKWLFTKYDQLNRPIITGIMTETDPLVTIRSTVDTVSARYDTLNTSLSHGYSNDSYPSISGAEILTVTYYDNYDFGYSAEYEYDNPELSATVNGYLYETLDSAQQAAVKVKGQVTGSKTRIIGTNDFILTVTYYDEKYRVNQTVSDNGTDDIDRVSNLYDFIGQVLQTYTSHNQLMTSQESRDVHRFFNYDHGGRLLSVQHSVNGGELITLASNSYDELSQLSEKNLHAHDSQHMQSLDYAYNIRGWLRSINDSGLTSSGDTNTDLFGMELHYDTNPIDNTKTFFNGNIGGMEWSDWSATSGSMTRSYAYDYDKLNRLKTAHSEGGNGSNAFSVPRLSYDLNGNILNLDRRGSATDLIDSISYSYRGNQLWNVKDLATDTTTFHDQNDSTTTGFNDYIYDANGNMVKDLNKGIDSIYYNHLNLPAAVVFNAGDSIAYTYDAAGIKLKQEVYVDGSLETKREYVGEFFYENDTLRFINHEEGRIVYKPNETEPWDYQYYLKDHLGNTRVTFSTYHDTDTSRATMEIVNQTSEEDWFTPYEPTAIHITGLGNNSAYVARLNTNESGDSTTFNGITELKTMLKVNKGDTLHLSVQAYYDEEPVEDGFFSNAELLAMILTGGEGGTVGAEGATTANSNLDESIVGTMQTNKDSEVDQNVPRAYLNYMLFKEDMTYITSGFTQISSSAEDAWETVVIDGAVEIEQSGYAMVYVSNETKAASIVDFDNLEIVHAKTPVVQADDYYPFGLTFNSFTRSYSEPQRYKYNGKEEQEDWGVGVLDYGARFYMADIGRFGTIDPMNELTISETPFHYVSNNPIRYIDPTGMFKVYVNGEELKGKDKRNANKYLTNLLESKSSSSEETSSGGCPDGQDCDENKSEDGKSNGGGTTVAVAVAVSIGETSVAGPIGLAGLAGWGIGQVIGQNIEGFSETVASGLEWLGVPSELLRGPDVNYTPAPKVLEGFPNAERAKTKNGRTRWKDADGDILEWDSQHGDVEVYNKKGKHKGSADPKTGEMIKDPVPGRKIDP